MKRLLATLLIAQLAGVPLTPKAANPAPRFAVIGDSNTDSASNPFFLSWAEALAELEPGWTVTNLAASGAKTIDDGNAIPDGLVQLAAALTTNPDYVLCSLGTNDVLAGSSVAQIKAGYSALRQLAFPTPIIFIGPFEMEPIPGWDPAQWNVKVAQIQGEIPMLGVHDQDDYVYPIDGLHLDGYGQMKAAQIVRARLETVVAR